MRTRSIVSASALAASLISYWYSREINKDAVPYVMIGGFIGTLIGEVIAGRIEEKTK